MTQETRLNLKINTKLFKPPNIGQVDSEVSRDLLTTLKQGVGADQANTVFFDRRTLLLSVTHTYDLAGGINDAFANVINFTTIKTLILFADQSNTDFIIAQCPTVALKGWSAPWGAFDRGNKIYPGGLWYLSNPDVTGMPVVGGTTDQFEIVNNSSSASAKYELILIGVTS